MPRPLSFGVCAAALLVGCGSWGRVGGQPAPTSQSETLTQILDLNTVYRRIGRLLAGAPLPFVGDVAFLAGPGDSTVVLVALSLENRNLAFQRDGDLFVARYQVTVSAQPAAGAPVRSEKEQTLKVRSFTETQRADESILYQDGLTLAPGAWKVSVEVNDRGSGKSSRAEASYQVPALGPGSRSIPHLVYQAKGRATRTAQVAIILNPRGTIAYGGDTALVYVEGYRLPGPTVLPVRLRDARDSVIVEDSLRFDGGREVESAVIRFAPDSAPLGEIRIVVGDPPHADSSLALVSFSQGWVVTNFDDMVSLLRYFPQSAALDSLRKAPAPERGRLWKAFWRSTDPNPATPANESLDEYFARIALANARFRGEGVPGWRTDRGEVLIRLGEPDDVFDASPASEGRLIRWGYTQAQLVLFFIDESGFGRFRLTPASRADLERTFARLTRQAN